MRRRVVTKQFVSFICPFIHSSFVSPCLRERSEDLGRSVMSDAFHSARFGKKVWLTNHAIESMAKRNVTLAEVKTLIEEGSYQTPAQSHG